MNMGAPTVNRGEIVSMYAGLYSYLNEATPVIKGQRSGIFRDAKKTSVPVCAKLTVPFAHATVGVTPLHFCMASAMMYR